MEPIFQTADIKIEYLKFRSIKNFETPVQDFNKEYFNSIKQPYLMGNFLFLFSKIDLSSWFKDCSILFGFIVFAHDNCNLKSLTFFYLNKIETALYLIRYRDFDSVLDGNFTNIEEVIIKKN